MHIYRVVANERLTPSTIRVTLELDAKNKRPFIFSPGQYAAISFIRNGRPSVARCFSIVSSPTRVNQLQFSMRTHGRFTLALAKVNIGDVVRVRGPYGGFVYDPERHGDSIFIAGGIGITPFMSMVQYATDIQSTRRVSLIYGVQSQDDVPFHAELDSLVVRNPNLDVTYAVSKGSVDAITVGQVVNGRVTPELLRSKLAGTSKTVFICGPPAFMKGMVKSLTGLSVPRSQIITEAFNQGPSRQTGKVASWPQNMYTLGALGVGLGSLAIMVSEIVKSLPNVPLTAADGASTPLTSSGQREKDLDTLVNSLTENSNRPDSPTVTAALAAAQSTVSSPAPQRSTTSAPVVSNPAPTPAPTPAPVQPKCTTSQSGVTTCY